MCTNPDRIRRWFLPVSGELKEGGRYQLEGNAGGTVSRCDPPHGFDATWEMGGNISWVELRLADEGNGQTLFRLDHIALVDDERWGAVRPWCGRGGLGQRPDGPIPAPDDRSSPGPVHRGRMVRVRGGPQFPDRISPRLVWGQCGLWHRPCRSQSRGQPYNRVLHGQSRSRRRDRQARLTRPTSGAIGEVHRR